MSALLWIFAVANVANGLWMLFDPAGWYVGLPAAVPDTGRSTRTWCATSALRSVCGIGFGWCAQNLERALPVFVGITLFYGGHATTHVADIVEGRLPPSALAHRSTAREVADDRARSCIGVWLARRGN